MTPAISITDLSVEFHAGRETVRAIDHLNLTVESGHVFGFLGPNGAGKTTTMHVLLGFVAPTGGRAEIFGEDVNHAIARQRIGYLPEHPDSYGFLTGRELLRMTGRLFLLSGSELRSRVDTVLSEVDMQTAADRRVGTYSRGMLQRICLAQALINNPDLVILGEPTGGLDPFGRQAIRDIISELKKRGKTVFFSSHELSEVELVCDQIAILSEGRVLAQGDAAQIVPDRDNLEKFFIDIISEDRRKTQQ